MKKIAFRVDASINIGTGHVMRCLTLAKKLATKGAKIKFICRDLVGNKIDFIQNNGFEVEQLTGTNPIQCTDNDLMHKHWLETTQHDDAVQCNSILDEFSPDWVIIDHYALDYRWQKMIRPFTQKIFVIDDLADRKHDCNMLLDQTFGVDKSLYIPLTPDDCQIYTGANYALLRDEFSEQRKASSTLR